MTAAAWIAFGFCLILIALAWVRHAITRLANDTRDGLEDVLDAVLTPSGEHVWITPLPPELAVWDAEVETWLNKNDGADA